MRPVPIAVALLLLAAGCNAGRAENPPAAEEPQAQRPEVAIGTYVLGTSVTPDGAIPRAATGDTFTRGGQIYLSVDVGSASADQMIVVQWLDGRGVVLRTERRDVHRERRLVVFVSGPTAGWTPGPHRAVVIIDGRRVTELPFEVV